MTVVPSGTTRTIKLSASTVPSGVGCSVSQRDRPLLKGGGEVRGGAKFRRPKSVAPQQSKPNVRHVNEQGVADFGVFSDKGQSSCWLQINKLMESKCLGVPATFLKTPWHFSGHPSW